MQGISVVMAKKSVDMRSLTNRCIVASLGMAAIIGSASVASAEPGITKDTIKIGTFGPLTGPVSLYGYPIIDGTVAIYKQVNDAGGINGRKIEVVFADDGCDAAKTRAAVKKLIYSDDVFMINGGNCSASVYASRDEFIDDEVPFMVMASTLDKISVPTEQMIFTTTQTGSRDGQVMARFVKSMPNVKRVALVRHTDDWADAHVDAIRTALKASGVEIVADIPFERNATDATTQVLKVKDQNPDAVFLVTYPNESATFLRDSKKYGLKGPFVAASANMDLAAVAERAGGADTIANVYVSSYLIGPVGSPEMKESTDLYMKYFPNDKVQTLSFYGMSGAYAVVDALRRAGPNLTRAGFAAALNATKDAYAGPAYCKITFTAEDHQGCTDGTVWGVKDGKIVAIGPTWKQ